MWTTVPILYDVRNEFKSVPFEHILILGKIHFKSILEDEYAACTLACSIGDLLCVGQCSRQFNENLELCPCQSQCPHGCPCPEFECLVTTTSAASTTSLPLLPRTSVLILSTHPSSLKLPVITNASGKEEYPVKDFYFLFGENTNVFESCSLTWHGEFYVFGGNGDYTNQISKLNGCKLERIGSLEFEFDQGDCAVINDVVHLCFNYDQPKRCSVSNSPDGNYRHVSDSYYNHRTIRIGAGPGS